MSVNIMTTETRRRPRVAMETGGLPLVSTFALLTIVAGKCNYHLRRNVRLG